MRICGVLRHGFFALAALSAACGDDSDDEAAAAEECREFARTWCGSSIDCLVMVGRLPEAQRAANLDVCVDTAIAAAQCKRAVAIGSTYLQCLSEMQTMECSRWDVPTSELSSVQPPESCRGVILIQ
jgi:hypothetical protein